MNNTEMREYRRELRKHGTPAEGGLWKMLKAKQVAGLQFRRQFSVGDYILDFYCPALRLAIELDGDYHYHWTQPELDYERERILWEKYNIRVIRFENKVVFQNPQVIIDSILKHKEIMDYAREDGENLKWLAEEYDSTAYIAPPPTPLPASGAGELITHDYQTNGAGEYHAAETQDPTSLSTMATDNPSETIVTNSPAPLAGRGAQGAGNNMLQPSISNYTDTIGIAKGYATFGEMDIYDHKGKFLGRKTLYKHEKEKPITDWIASFGVKDTKDVIGYTGNTGPDFQHNQYLYIAAKQGLLKTGRPNNETKYSITKNNLIPISIYFSARLCQEATWLNDRDQFLYPNDGWKKDYKFQVDCLVYTLFHGQNRISLGTRSSSPAFEENKRTGTSALQANHWIPFTEKEVGAQSLFTSHFMSDYLAGKITGTHSYLSAAEPDLFSQCNESPAPYPLPASGAGELYGQPIVPLQNMSEQAHAVMDAGRELWRYYHRQPDAQADASYYDIRRYFQGTDGKGRMNPDSEDKEYMRLWDNLKAALRVLAAHIEPKVYKYGFLLGSNLQTDTEQSSALQAGAEQLSLEIGE
ncbi:MAG: endonuclease domain-containing protein [Paludibacteraceae bacterium]|nr:endonuclease domain-containing protein [Paludibacteraceae bacterium]